MRSLDQIKSEIVNDILELRSDVRLVEGDTQYDVVVISPANQFYKYEILLEFENRTRNLDGFTNIINDESFKSIIAQVLGFKQDGTAYTVEDVNTLISARLDAYVFDWGVVRSVGSKASGFVIMYLTNSATVSWDNATTFTSKSGATYVATSAISEVVPSYNSSLGVYYVTIPVEASVANSVSNATAGSITAVDPKPINFSYTVNTSAIDGGSDEESDLNLIDRAQNAWAERVNGSKGVYERIAEAEDYVDDALAMDEDNVDEGIYVGSVCDVFTQFSSEDTELVEETFYWPGEEANADEEQFDFVPANQPMLSTVTPTVFRYLTAGTEEQVIPDGTGTIVTIISDTNTFSGSAKATDKIRITMALNTTSYQRKLKILYTYDKNPFKLQSVFDDTENKMIGPPVAARKAVEVPIRVIMELQIAFGYVVSEVESVVTANILKYFNGGTTSFGQQYARRNIGEEVVHTDIANIVLRTEGVVSYDRDTFFVVNTITGDLSDPTTIKNNQYATLLDVLFDFSTFNLSNFTASSSGI